MVLFKILQIFLLPIIFIFILILIGTILLKKRTGKIFLIIGLSFYYLFSITLISDLILKPLENQYRPLQKEELEKTDKIVLLLGDWEDDILRSGEVLRLYFEKEKLGTDNIKVIISGADPLNSEENDGQNVKNFLIERGISEKDIILEDKSRNTKESADNVKELIGGERFFLVTSAYHMPRSMESFQKIGMNPIAAPGDFKVKKQYDILDFFPSSQKLRNSDLALHEYFGILFYRLKY